jgi:tRNA(Ile)-lysidine synthase
MEPDPTAVDPQSLPAKLASAWPPAVWADVTVLVAVSGGPDSVALLRALTALKAGGVGRLVVAHYNHRWRRAQSNADEQFVRDLACQLGLPVLIERAATSAVAGGQTQADTLVPKRIAPRPGSEESARQARYAFLSRAAHEVGARYVALGHTADDQVETVLHHLFRGTGLAGLAGMPRVRALDEATALIRPLLDVWRHEVLAYLQSCGQPYRVDRTNRQLRFRRNWLRHKLLPQVEQQYGPHVRHAILRLASIARSTDEYLAQQAERWLQTACRTVPEGVELLIQPDVPPVLLHAAVARLWKQHGWPMQDFSFDHWNQLFAAIRIPGHEAPSSWDLPGNIHAEWTPPVLRLTRRPSTV